MRNKLILAAVVVVGCASIAYAAFTQVLTIQGTGTIAGDWDVAITDISKVSSVGATENAAPSFTDTSATFDVDLAYPGASATYNVIITNNGSIPAKLTSIDGLTQANAAAPLYMQYGLSGLVAGTTTLEPAANNTATVTVTWDEASTPTTSGQSKTATITLNYDQNTP